MSLPMAASASSDASKPPKPIVPEIGSLLLGEDLSVCKDVQYFICGAVELAEKLVGDYLWVAGADIVVRIMETEEYPKADALVFVKMFSGIRAAKLSKFKPGDIVSFVTSDSKRLVAVPFAHIVAVGGDLVLLRAFEAMHGHTNIKTRRGGEFTPAKFIMDSPMKSGTPSMGTWLSASVNRYTPRSDFSFFLTP